MAQAAPPQFAGQLGGARPQTKSFASETASLAGESKSQVNRHVARADALGADLERVVETKGSQACARWQRNVKLISRSGKRMVEG